MDAVASEGGVGVVRAASLGLLPGAGAVLGRATSLCYLAIADDCGAAAAAAAAAAEAAAAALQRWLLAAPCIEVGPCCQQGSGTPAHNFEERVQPVGM
jgi:hypothetical protein